MTRLLLVEDHVLVRQSIRAFLQSADFEIVGEAGTGPEALDLAYKLRPDLVLMDIHLPKMNGIEATRRIRRECPDIRIVVLTAYEEKAYRRALTEIGVDGIVVKTMEFSELLSTIQKALSSESRTSRITCSATGDQRGTLTEREIEVLKCAARGWTNKQIGLHLNISDRTVQVHLQAIYQKFGVTTRTEAVLRAVNLDLISPIMLPFDGVLS